MRYADGSQEVVGPGDVYYIPPRHVLIYKEETECVEFSPATELEKLMPVIDGNINKMNVGS